MNFCNNKHISEMKNNSRTQGTVLQTKWPAQQMHASSATGLFWYYILFIHLKSDSLSTPDCSIWYCVWVNTPKHYRQLLVKDLLKVLMWRLERDPNPWPSGRKALNLPHWATRFHHIKYRMCVQSSLARLVECKFLVPYHWFLCCSIWFNIIWSSPPHRSKEPMLQYCYSLPPLHATA